MVTMVGRGSALGIGAALVLFCLLLSAASPAAAQSTGENASACADGERIDLHTVLCDAELEGGDAVVTIHSDVHQTVTLSDAGAFSNGGEVPTRDVGLMPNETVTVRFSVTETQAGKAGVGLFTAHSMYSVILKDERHLIGGPWTVNDARYAGAGGSAGAAFVAAVTVLRRRRGEGGEPRQIA